MSKIKVDTVTNLAGTGAPNIPNGVTIGGVALASVNTQEHYAQSTEPTSPKDGAVWYDTDDDKAYVYINSEFYELTYTNLPYGALGSRGIFGGSYSTNSIEYITIATPGNGTDFGDLTVSRDSLGACAGGGRGLFGSGFYFSPNTYSNIIDYITIATPGNATDFGDLTLGGYYAGALSNGSRGVFFLGTAIDGGNFVNRNNLDYVTIATPGNGTDFGDLTVSRYWTSGAGSKDRGLFGGGLVGGTRQDVIDYITIATPGNATDFGNLTVARQGVGACSDGSRALFAGGSSGPFSSDNTDIIDYVTIDTTGNATDFGDLLSAINNLGSSAACASTTRGVFAGGHNVPSNVIQYVTIQTPGNATDFGDLITAKNTHAGLAGD